MLLFACLFVGLNLVTAQTQQIKGIVLAEEDGQPVVGASILVKGTGMGTITDIQGNFSLSKIPNNAQTLVVSYIGMQTQEVGIKENLKIILKSDAEVLDEVVVVAYGTAKKESLTGSIAVVDAKKIENRLSSSVTGALEGTAPGVQVNNTYGEPGSAPSIRIRGFSTINGSNNPLYIVDGAPYDGSIADLNNADIASLSILKDAASAALYGNRAANGVVLITTKKGKDHGKTSVSFNMNQGFYTRGIPEYDRLGTDQWMETQWTGMKNYAMTLPSLQMSEADARKYASNRLISDLVKRNIYNAKDNALFDENGKLIAKRQSGYDDLNWYNELERTGHRQEYGMSATTSGEKFNVFSSIGYLKEDGYIINTGFDRLSGRVNTTYTPTKWLKTGLNLAATSQKTSYNEDASGNAYANPFYVARYMAPVYPLYLHNEDGNYALDKDGNKQYDLASSYLSNRHIVYELKNDKLDKERNTINGQAFATITLPYSIDFTVKGDINKSTNNIKKYSNPNIGDGATNNGRLTSTTYAYHTYNFQQQLYWAHEFGLHHLDILAGHENYSYSKKYTSGMNTDMTVDGNFTLGNFITNSYLGGYDDEYKTESYLSRLRYNYDQKYFADLSFRSDGSSRFNPSNRWGNFFSVGASWNITKEEFMTPINWVDYLKLRASYGEVGNDAGVDYYGYMALYELSKNGKHGSLIKKTLSALDIQWETTQTIDIALEGRLFDRVDFSLGYFNKRSQDLLFAVKLPLSAGSFPHDNDKINLTQNRNIGTISNQGIEFSANVDIINKKDWSWKVGADATFLKNEVVKLPEGKDILSGLRKYSEGHSIYEFFTYHYVGVDQMTGNSLYTLDPEKAQKAKENNKKVTINGIDYTTDTTYGLKDWAGSALPDIYGSFHSDLSWKGLNLNVLFTYSLGGKVFDNSYYTLMKTSASSAAASHKDILKSWSGIPEGMGEMSANRIWKNGIPVINHHMSEYNTTTSDRWLTDASYLVLKNISLSYNLPKKLISNLGIENLSLTAGVENAFTLTSRKGLNPQFSFTGSQDDTYTTARIYNLGLTVKF